METTQRDRDSLREAQQKLHSQYAMIIGNLVEHKIQDPVKYKTLSRQEQGLTKDARPNLPKIHYKSKYLTSEVDDKSKSESSKPAKVEDTEFSGLPVSLEEVQANLWLNMDRVEFDKLEWMSKRAEKEYQEKLKSTTHFDCQGKAVQPMEQVGDQDQKVHDIESLVKLLDSTFHPQITYALNVISKIATRATTGLYDAVFDDNIHEVLLKQCLLRVRHHIDSPNETVCQAALRCFRSLICNTQVDEIFMDKLYHLKSEEADLTMWLMTDQDEFDTDMKDNECVDLDAVLATISRTDILKRLKYLLGRTLPAEFNRTYYDCILDILIRFARYSRGMSWILSLNGFPKIVISLFQPSDIVHKDKLEQVFALKSLKFLRILAQASNELKLIDCQPGRKDIKLPDTLVATINSYYQVDYSRCGEQDANYESDIILHKIHNETLRLMKSLSTMKAFSSHVFSAVNLDQATLVGRVKTLCQLSALQDIKSPSSLDWQYAACLLDLLGSMMEHERYRTGGEFFRTIWITYVRPLTMQWITDILRERIIPHQDISIAIAVAIQQFVRCKDEKLILELHTLLLDKTSIPNNLSSNASLAYFKTLLREATTSSQLGSFLKIDGRLRDPVMLPSYGCMNLNTSEKYEYKLNSILSLHTPYILLDTYFKVLQTAGNRFGHLLKHYVNVDLVRYMRATACYYKYPVNYEVSIQKSALAQLEIRLLSNACLFVSHYYLSSSNQFGEPRPHEELKEIKSSFSDSYSQLILDTISVIGLINPEVGNMNDLKEKLLEKIVLNEALHSCLIRQSEFRETLDISFQNLQIYSMNRTKSPNAFRDLGIARQPADSSCLKSIYINSEQTGRFWILQPFIDYRFETCNDTKASQDNRWFARNVARNMLGRPLGPDCTDIDVISNILEFNALLCHRSPSFFELAVKPNIEEHLCLLGSIFLHDSLFLDPNLSRHLALNLEILLRVGLSKGIDRVFSDASLKLVTLGMTLMDFFNQLVDQYEAASYCDLVFTNFLLLFITTKCDKAFRRKLFSEKAETCLSQISIGHAQVWIPIEYLTLEKESDQEIKTLIQRSAVYTVKSSYLDYYRRYHTS